MSFVSMAIRSLIHYRRTHLAVAFGVATAVAVLAGALLVGDSVRRSLASIASSRLGQTAVVVTATVPFGESLASRIVAASPRDRAIEAVPLLVLNGMVQHESSGRRASGVRVYGIDQRFFSFHGVKANAPEGSDVLLSPELAEELGSAGDDVILVRVERLTDIPIDSLHGSKDDASRTSRMRSRGVLTAEAMGDFALSPTQGPVRAAFVALATLQRSLDQPRRANAILLKGAAGAPIDDVRTRLQGAIDSDDLRLRVLAGQSHSSIVVESGAGLVPDAVARAVEAEAASESLEVTPVLTWLANKLSAGGRSVPYSLVTAIGPLADGDRELSAGLGGSSGNEPSIVLNAWTAEDLRARRGDLVEIEYYRWREEGQLVTERRSFRVGGVVPMTGLAIERGFTPDYPGVTGAVSLADWNPPFPIDLKLVRPRDEDYWRRYRTAPKAFIPLVAGQRIWATRHGGLTSVRLRSPRADVNLEPIVERVRRTARSIDLSAAGVTIVDLRAQTAAASAGATDFSAYFSAFSVFLMTSALLLTALFFRLSVEQRSAQIGVLRATGYSVRAVQRLFLCEVALITIGGCASGLLLAIAWAALMMYGLRTWWVEAVGTTTLRLHVTLFSLAVGAAGGLLAGVLSTTITFRRLARRSPRALLTGASDVAASKPSPGALWLAAMAGGAAVLLGGLASAGFVPAAAGFFGAGTLVLIAGLAAFRRWLAGRGTTFWKSRSSSSRVVLLGIRNAAWRPGRSLTSAGLIASAVFLLMSVEAFRKDASSAGRRDSGTGGFALIAESTVPIARDVASREGREALGLLADNGGETLRGVEILPVRLRPGDDTSCLNLYQPKHPRVLGVPDRFLDAARFRFNRSMASTPAETQNPWLLLRASMDAGAVPAIADATSLEYVLHASVGDVVTIDDETSRPRRLRIVASLADSILQGELIVSDRAFLQLFPDEAGRRLFLIDVDSPSAQRLDQVSRFLETRLAPFGLDVRTSATELEAYHRVENTYLSTFQALGGLGLLLGSLGLAAVVARNVLERRRELAWLGAAGFSPGNLATLVVAENCALLGAGLAIGLIAAGVAVVPVLLGRATALPHLPMTGLSAVAAAALISAPWAARQVRKLPLVESLRSE